MRKNFTFIIAAMAAASMTAAVPTQTEQTVNGRTMAPACLYKAATENPQLKAPAKAAEGRKFDVSVDDIIYDQPAGNLKMYSKACDYYGMTMWGIMQGSSDSMPCRVAEAQDGSFYIYNPFSSVDTKSWLKASVDGDKMTVKLPQAIYADSDGTAEYVYVAQMCHYEWTDDSHSEGLYYTEEGETEIVFNKEGDTWVMQPQEEVNEHPMIMGLVSADDGTWCAYSDWNIRLTPFTDKPIELPSTTEPQDWVMNYTVEGQNICGNFVKIGIDGSDVYLSGISSLFPDAWIKGTIADGKMEFPSKQYLGADEMSNTFGYFFGFSGELKYNEEWDYWYTEYTREPSLIFKFDAEKGVYSTNLTLGVVKGENDTSWIDNYDQPKLSVMTEVTDFTPMNPILCYYSAPGDWSGNLDFYFPILNSEGQLLNTSKLYYRVFVDDELFEFYSDEYADVEDGTTEIPFDFTNGDTIRCYGTCKVNHAFSINFFDYKTIDVQTFYRNGDKEYVSDIMRMVNTVSVDAINSDSQVVEEKWFDLSGRCVNNPENGIYIKHVKYQDGNVRTFKTVVK